MRRLLFVAAGLLALLATALFALLGTSWGLARLLGFADGLGGIELSADVEDGSLLGGFTLRDFSLTLPGANVRTDRARVDWRPSGLRRGTVVLDEVALGAVTLAPQLAPPRGAPEGARAGLPDVALPVDLVVRQLTAGPVRLEDAEEPLAAQLALSAALRGSALAIDGLTLERPGVDARVSGEARLAGPWPHDLDLTAAVGAPVLQTARGAAVALEADLSGNLQSEADEAPAQTELTVSAGGDALTARLTLIDPLGHARWEFAGGFEDFAAVPAVRRVRVRGSGRLGGRNGPRRATLSGRATLPTGEDGSGGRTVIVPELVLRQENGRILVAALSARLPGERLAVEARGALEPPAELRVAGTLVRGGAPAASLSFDLAGTPEGYRVTADGHVGAVPVRLELDGDGSALTAEGIVSPGTGRLEVDGEVAWRPEPRWRATLEAHALDPAVLAAEFPGELSGTLRAEGAGARFSARLVDLSGTLRGRPVDGSGRVAGSLADVSAAPAGAVEELVLELSSDDARLSIDGDTSSTGELEGELSLRVPDLGGLLPEGGGALQARARARGDAVTFELSGEALAWRDWAAGSLTASGTLAPGPSPDLTLEAEGSALAAHGVEVPTFTLDASGWGDALTAELEARVAELGEVRAAVTFDRAGEVPSLTVDSLALDAAPFGDWALEAPLTARFGDGVLAVERRCLAAGELTRSGSQEGRVCLAANLEPGEEGRALLTFEALPLDLLEVPLSQALGEPLRLSGSVAGSVEAGTAGLSWTSLDAALHGENLALAVPERIPGDALTLASLDASLAGDADRLRAELTAAAPEVAVTARGALVDPLTGLRAIDDGRLELALGDLHGLRTVVPATAGLEGALALELAAEGPLGAPDVRGQATVTGLAFEVPAQGLHVEDGRIEAEVSPGGTFSLAASLPVNEGVLAVTGEGSLEPLTGPAVRLSARGDELTLADTADLRLVASPDLTLRISEERLALRGEVRVDSARITTPEAGTVIEPSPDVVVAGPGDGEAPPLGRDLDAEVTITLGEDVTFEGFGMNATLEGTLRLVDRPGTPPLASGEIVVSGRYEAWGQDLTIDDGRLLYAGTRLTDPALSLEAVRTVDDVEVGVRVTGPARAPEIEVFSDPPLQSTQALAYLVLGRPLDEATTGEGVGLASGALALAMGTSTRLTEALGGQLGFSEFGVSMREDLGGAAFSIGRYLSPSLYLEYSIGLAEAVDLITLRYRLTDRWSLETEIGEETRAAVRYEVDTGALFDPGEEGGG